MQIPSKELFERLDPPPGGLARLRVQLDERERRAAAWRLRPLRWAVAVLLMGAIVGLAVVSFDRPRSGLDDRLLAASSGPLGVRLGLAEPPSEAVSVPPGLRHRVAVERVEVEVPGVVYYRVAVLGEPGPSEDAAAGRKAPSEAGDGS